MIRKLFSDALIYTLPTILSRGISFLLLPVYTRILSTSDYGILDLVMVWGNLINLTISLEITQGIARFYSDEKDILKQKGYVASAFWFSTFCYILFLVIALSFSSCLSTFIFQETNQRQLVQLATTYIFFNGLVYFIQNQLRWELRSKQYATLSVLVSFSSAIGAVVFGYWLNWQLFGVLLSMLLAHFLGYIYGISALRSSISLRIDLSLLVEMLRYSAPLVPAGIAVFVSTYIDRIMINHFLSLDEVGIYGLGFRLASVVSILIIGFQKALTPLIYTHYSKDRTRYELAFIFRLFIACALFICLFASLFSKEILWLVADPKYYSASTVIVFLVPSILFANMYIFSPGISIEKKSYIIFWINFLSAALNIGFNWLLIPKYGFVGASLATLLGSFLAFLAYMLFSQHFYYVPHRWGTISFSAISISTVCLLGNFVGFENSLDIALKALIFLAAIIFLFWIKLITINEIKEFTSL